MARSASTEKRAREEAANWFARLNRRSVPLDPLEDFREWRKDPANRAAYQTLESAWRAAGALENDPAINAALAAAIDRPARPKRQAWIWRRPRQRHAGPQREKNR